MRVNNEKIAKSLDSFETKRKRIIIEISPSRPRFKISIFTLKIIKRYIEDDIISKELKKFRLIFKEVKVTNKIYALKINKVSI